MGALLPTLQANHLREGLTDYLATTFALTDPDAHGALADFVDDPDNGMFKGPYLRLRLPFAPATGNWSSSLDWWPEAFTPYGHQASAFDRLSTKSGGRPQPTLVTTGTGSGKTEAFLIPILDHVLRAKRAGVTGMKALILYPMNALANDQAERLARLIAGDPRMSGVSAGLYTGETGSGGRTVVSKDGLITDRTLMHSAPPDILLTNYKMLDHMLLHPARASLWKASADSLQFIVLDEFHTYDGAQGTDVAMLLRRLGLTLRAARSAESTDELARPLGRITPVATSATLGSKAQPTEMLTFAHTVFGEQFASDAVIGETRLTVQQWLAEGADGRRLKAKTPHPLDAVSELAAAPRESLPEAVFASLFNRSRDITPAKMLAALKTHPLLRDVLDLAQDAVSKSQIADRIFPPTTEHLVREAQLTYVDYLFALLSHLRAELGRAALSVDVHLWVRELSRIDRAVSVATKFRWSDDGVDGEDPTLYLPALYCRHCGRSGWGARLHPAGSTLDVTDDSIRSDHASGGARFRAFISATAEAQRALADNVKIEGLQWLRIEDRELTPNTPDAGSTELIDGLVLPVLVLDGPSAEADSKKDTCPSCGTVDGIRFLGSAVATQLSVTLSNLFGDATLDVGEKKALMFTDSVQDAAHRAGFVQARSHTLSLRSTMRSALGSSEMNLSKLTQNVLARAGEDPMMRYNVLPPDLADRPEFVAFWKAGSPIDERRAATERAERRLHFDIDLEFGLQSRLGRSLEVTGSVVAEVFLGVHRQAETIGLRAIENTEHQQAFTTDARDIQRWVRGTVERIRTRGAIHHEWLRKYVERDATRVWIWGKRPRGVGMPAFPKGRPAPFFPAIGKRAVPEGFDPITAPATWYAQWTARCLGVPASDAAHLAKSLFKVLTERDVVRAIQTESGLTAYGLEPTKVLLRAPLDADLEAGDHLLVCDVCHTPNPGTQTVIDQLDGARCLLVRCPGRLHRTAKKQNFYRELYDASEMKRVVAREHTALLPPDVRLGFENAFKNSADDPQAPNVLVATPTLEMGIDIGDLSTVMLASLPRSVSSYLQRVGRAGRLTGNSLVLAYVRGRGEHLPKLFDPTSVIQGDVAPPATFLKAEEILQRQYAAHIVDRLAREPGAQQPATPPLQSFDPDTWMAEVLDLADAHAEEFANTFLAQFEGVIDEHTATQLRAWVTPVDGPSGLRSTLQDAVHRWNRDLKELTTRRTAVDEQMPEFKKRAAHPAATEEDKRDLRMAEGSLRLLKGQIKELLNDYWISVLERYGVLPNYTLLDDSVTLDVGITWIDPDSNEYLGEATSYKRGSRVALTELAPGSTFYAQGLAAKIDAVDLGAGASNIQTWRLCPQCGWIDATTAGETPKTIASCPRCHNPGIADTSQLMPVVEMARVSAEVRRDEASISDGRDDRHKERFHVVTAADIDPTNVEHHWYHGDDFGAEYLRRIDIRWINLGKRTSQGPSRTIAGQDSTNGLFRVCSSCGQLDSQAGQNSRYEHRSWCRYRNHAQEHVREIALARTLRTQGVLLHLPPELEYDSFAHPSLSAAILRGLREVIGGSPEHLEVATIPDAIQAPNQRALLIHDTVPGGTGYLTEFARPAKVHAVLAAAFANVSNCPCREEDRQACHRCLLPFASPYEIDKVSRHVAEKVLRDILDDVDAGTWLDGVHEKARERPNLSPESLLEKKFYKAFTDRLKAEGATVHETPGTYGPSATFHMPGAQIRRWKLSPQAQLDHTVPDFHLQTNDPDIPDIYVFADGRKYHASADINRVAGDARKRAGLRPKSFVWSFSYEDLERFESNSPVTPPWFRRGAAEAATKKQHLKPEVLSAIHNDPITQLLTFVRNPVADHWRTVASNFPLLFVGPSLAAGNRSSIATAALAVLEGKPVDFGTGPDRCWLYSAPGLVVTAAMQPGTRALSSVVAVDDRTEMIEALDGHAWKEWLRLSNWFGHGGDHRITTYSLLLADATAPGATPAAELSTEWQMLLAQAVTDSEKEMIVALSTRNLPVPELGYPFDDNEAPLDFAWPSLHVAVSFDEVPATVAESGWTVCPPDIDQIAAALETSGVN